jgi:hypothetical protein
MWINEQQKNVNSECQSTQLPGSKDTIWQTRLYGKIGQSVDYKRPMILTEINTSLRWKAWRSFTKQMAPQNR